MNVHDTNKRTGPLSIGLDSCALVVLLLQLGGPKQVRIAYCNVCTRYIQHIPYGITSLLLYVPGTYFVCQAEN